MISQIYEINHSYKMLKNLMEKEYKIKSSYKLSLEKFTGFERKSLWSPFAIYM